MNKAVHDGSESGAEQVGDRIRRARRARKLTQVSLAEQAGVEQATISKLETGDRARGHEKTIEQLARVLNVSAAWLRDGEGEVPESVVTAETADPIGRHVEEFDALLDAAFDHGGFKSTDSGILRALVLREGTQLLAAGALHELILPACYWLHAVAKLRELRSPITMMGVMIEAWRLAAVDLAKKAPDGADSSGQRPTKKTRPRQGAGR